MKCLVLSSAAHLKGLQVGPPHGSGVYASSEIRIGVPGRLAKESVSVIASLLPHANSFLEILFTADTLKHIEAQINIVIPRLAYARPEKPKAGEDSGVQVVCRPCRNAVSPTLMCWMSIAPCLGQPSDLRMCFHTISTMRALPGIDDSVVVASDSGSVARRGRRQWPSAWETSGVYRKCA